VTTKVRIGVVGLGGIANYHARAFLADPRAELVACCDINPERLTAFAEQHSVPAHYHDYERMLDEAALDIVVICTDETLHAAMTVQGAARRPKAILCEKPMAMSLAEADAMLEACRANNVILVIGHQRRFKPQYGRAKEILQEGAIGQLEQILAVCHDWSSLLVDGTHIVNLVRSFVDDVPAEWVMGQIDARSRRVGWNHVLEDAALMLVKFQGGVRAWLTCGGHIAPTREPLGAFVPFSGDQYTRLLLLGSAGQIVIEGDYPPAEVAPLRVVKGDRTDIVPMEHPQQDRKYMFWHNGLSPQVDLLNALKDGHRHQLNGESARADLEILLATYESARVRRLIALPLENRNNPFDQILAEQRAGAPPD